MAADARGPRRRVSTQALTGAEAGSAALVDAFCDALWLEDGLSKNTLSSYRRDLSQLGAFLKKMPLEQAGEEELFAFFAARHGRASSAARMLSTLKRFYGWCLRERHVKADPTLRIDPAIEQQQIDRLRAVRSRRDSVVAEAALAKLEAAAAGTENLAPIILECVEAQATVGEISNRFRKVWGEYKETSTV